MSIVHLQNIEILNPNAAFSDPYLFKVTFECISPLEDDLEWKLIYVGSAQSKDYDQDLDNCMVGPVPVGVNSFEFEAAAPSPDKIPASDLLGVTVILLTGCYKDSEFIRVGYYVNNAYESEEMRENPPEEVDLAKIKREVLVSKPRVTRFNIKWDADTATGDADASASAAGAYGSASAKEGDAGEGEGDISWPAPTEADFKAQDNKPPPTTAFAPVSVS
ncbi:anti-silence-domain-containing protein [Tilletiaria anomala UBC 951]|uniref:Anti-silencing function protein 1 n=1 Tax=Tilletiaria anomala (strain ATCC 24038 / CBS 436.72 / UBC 951) TaxID=1037660 RepID=A0A066VM76_TILAU|nr:anti-silence-domain-containing protein [Tilletiaria anomala UBC 951]KDN39834.1 anti-silence-domain-containing protein [Tilletiaria anomala UBC 951]